MRGKKVKYNYISIKKSISNIFILNSVCVLTNDKYKTYQTRFIFCCQGHALGVGLGLLRGQKLNSVSPSVRNAISSLTIRRTSTKCEVWITHMNGACNRTF